MKTKDKKKIYVLPETNVVKLKLDCLFLTSYTQGGGGIYEDDDIIDNGSY